jgi:hypothetical protein
MTTTVLGRAIEIGYEWRQRLVVTADAVPFPSGATFTAHVRASRASSAILSTLTTANDGLVRVNDTSLDIVIPAADTALMTPGSVVMDIVRTDTNPDVHMGFTLTIPTLQPVTRGL